MRDAAAIEDAGVPTVTLIHDVFEHAAQLQADALGRGDLKRVVLAQGKPEESDEDVSKQARDAFDRIMALLTAS